MEVQVRPVLVVILLSVLSAAALASEDAVIGCSGFVEASPALAKLRKETDSKLDYSGITVELLNEDGLVKDQTQCAPNGYYFLPVYDKGSFMVGIKGPEGWNFEPKHVQVIVDKESCNGNRDINFQYTGFSLSGKVLGAYGGATCRGESGDGPAGVTVTLSSETEQTADGKAVAAVTEAGGLFSFTNLPSGKYRIAASHPTWQISTLGPTEVELGWRKGEVPDTFQVAGYDLQGSVLAQGNPVLGVQVFLFSDSVKAVTCPAGSGDFLKDGQVPLCHAVTGPDGKFLFTALPCGDYMLVPYYKGEATVFDVSPSHMKVEVGHGSVSIRKPFEVTGFSVGGRVMNSQGEAVGGVKIFIDGTEKAVTDVKGMYKIDQVTSAQYTISATKNHYKFASLESFSVLPNLAALPDIRAIEYDLCGSVQLDGDQFNGKRSVALTHGPVGVKPQAKSTDASGDFCFSVPPGDYRLSPVITAAEGAAGLLFSPSYLDVTVTSGPVHSVIFKQGYLSISGRVKCIDFCPKTVKLTLITANDSTTAKSRSLYMKEDQESFTFDQVIPGSYSIQIENEAEGEGAKYGDWWCWEEKVVNVDVASKAVTGVSFRQAGWIMRINSTNEVNASALHDVIDPFEINLKRGMNDICVPASGELTMLFMYQCVYFGAFMITHHTDNQVPINLVAKHYLVQGMIKIDSRIVKDASNFSDYIFPRIFTADGVPVDQSNFATLKSAANESNPYAVYEYVYWGNLGEKLKAMPRHNGLVQDEVYDSSTRAESSEDNGEATAAPVGAAESFPGADIDKVQEFEEKAARAKTIRETLELTTIHNPAVTGMDTDEYEELLEKYSSPVVPSKDEVVKEDNLEDEAAGSQTETADVSDSSEETTEVAEGDVAQEEDTEPADPYLGLPYAARPPFEPEETWPPRKRLLFYPRQIFFNIEKDECQPQLPDLEARIGVYLEGKVVPPLAKVNITVVAETPSATAGWQAGEEVLWTLTQEEGLYVAGPLYDDATYSVKASMPDYDFRAIDKYSFEGQKLGRIVVSLRSDSAANETLPPVLLSLSGDGSYRKNAATPSGEGFVFDSLFPGSYFLRPVLKEYSFKPPALSIELGGSETKDVTFSAKRVAYSVFGTVTSLGGQPEEGVPVEARSEEGGRYETTDTDSNGKFRLRGLIPGSKYTVAVALRNGSAGSSRIERATPKSVDIQVQEKDTEDVNFLVFRQSKGFDLQGSVEGTDFDKWQLHLSVEVALNSDPTQVKKEVPVPLSGFFEVQGLDWEDYTVRLKFALPSQSHVFESEPVTIDLRGNTKEAIVNVGTLRFLAAERQPEQDLTSAAVLPLVLSILVIALFASLSRLRDAYQWAMGAANASGSAPPAAAGGGWLPAAHNVKGKKETQRISQRKRTY